jgi:glycosyltransferase involved in cell wall biosynthesis
MKILQIHNEYRFKGGEESVVENERDLLVKNDCEVFQLIKKNSNEIINVFDQIKVAWNVIYSRKSKSIVFDKLKKINPDIVHIHNTFPLWSFSIIDACYEMKIPVVMTLHNFRLICAKGVFYRSNEICEICSKSSPFNAIRYGCYQNSIIKSIPVSFMIQKYRKGLNLLKKVNKFIVLTEFSKKKFLEINFPANKIAVKPNFIPNNSIFNTETKKSGFLYASRLSEEKGILDLIIAHKKFNFDLTVCGDGPLKRKLISNKNINYLGFLNKSDLTNIMKKSKFLVFPSKWYEGFPIILLEAFALGTIVIAPNLGSIQSIIKHEKNGILFKPNDINDLVNKIKWVLSNENKCEEIKKNAKKEFLEKYSDEVNYWMLIKIYEEAIKENQNN